ncbi:MAG: hypothetical protein NTY75_01465 [Candidatus Shapirobacteria bacterium]|nr:hypothetical protein [Candidatus Shapirobacteria bacterium]
MKKYNNNSGFASVALIIFTVIATTVIATATYVMVNSSLANAQAEQSSIALNIAESGAENALVRFARDVGYTGEDLPLAGGTAYVTLPNSTTIQSRGVYGNFTRTIQIKTTDYITTNNLSINSWQEIY